jgi:hypothetical protein
MARSSRSVALALLLASLPAAAQGPKLVPERLAAFELPDQHGSPHRVDGAVRILILSRDMDGGAVVRGALETRGEAARAFLAERGAVYVADVSRMPGIVRSLLAMPRMRGRPYPVLLDTAGEATAGLPSEPGRASLVWLEDLRPVRVEFVATPEELLAKLGLHPAPRP